VADRLRFVKHDVLDDLVATIRTGRCVAFVGAGFSADTAGPTWAEMVDALIERLQSNGLVDKKRAQTARDYATNGDYDSAASIAIDHLDDADSHLRAIVRETLGSASRTERDTLLAEIPFASVLTTNYDGRPGGIHRGHDAYREVLRGADGSRDWIVDWRPRDSVDAVALHGQLNPADGPGLVLTRRQYRDLLYRDPGYRTFLRSLFATTTVLFLGKSFGDEYLNEMRSEILSLVGGEHLDKPLAYAAVPASEFTQMQEEHLRNTEGIQLLRFGGEAKEDFGGFDTLLTELRDRTNFFRIMQREMAGLRVLWLDTNAEGHWGAYDVDRTIRRIESGSESLTIDRVSELAEAQSLLASEEFDFVISNFGFQAGVESTAVQFLDHMHDARIRTPLIVFGESGSYEDLNRLRAVEAGAYAFESRYDGLFRRIHELASSLKQGRSL
jgi:SIR2-like protein